MLRIILSLLLLTGISATAQTEKRQKEYNLSKSHVAIQGYDPVSYFTSGKAVEGSKNFSASVEGVTYYFSTAQNKQTFLSSPKMYEPQYGGWCAYAMGAKGEKVSIDPETFKIIDGKLFLFYNSFFNNTLKSWNKDQTQLKQKADANWAKIFQ